MERAHVQTPDAKPRQGVVPSESVGRHCAQQVIVEQRYGEGSVAMGRAPDDAFADEAGADRCLGADRFLQLVCNVA